ncbi:MAG: AraC family transcriptional regulator [Bacteroidales bacterium]|nr:AraC family transcriptional regulator [Bacteroidales bacterium]
MIQHLDKFSVETIREMRSALPDTYYGQSCNISFNTAEILRFSKQFGEPMYFADMGIALCCEGKVESETNLVQNIITAGTLELFSPGSIYQLKSISDDCRLIGMVFTPFMVKEIFDGNTPWELMAHKKDMRVMLTEEEMSQLEEMAEIYLSLLIAYGEGNVCCRKMAGTILSFARPCFENAASDIEPKISRASLLCRRFVSLLGQTKGKHRDIAWFARQLCVSNHYLSVAVKQSGGRTVKEIIDKSVTAEIKVRLLYSDKTMAEIADELDFKSCSLLSKYFKSQTGLSPSQYRKEKKG